jgi:hypothetical protein
MSRVEKSGPDIGKRPWTGAVGEPVGYVALKSEFITRGSVPSVVRHEFNLPDGSSICLQGDQQPVVVLAMFVLTNTEPFSLYH